MKISELLWNAANKHLDPPEFDDSLYTTTFTFSCDAVYDAILDTGLSADSHFEMSDKTMAFLEELGLDTGSLGAFKEFKSGAQRQEARYAWLMFAAMVAEEEGL